MDANNPLGQRSHSVLSGDRRLKRGWDDMEEDNEAGPSHRDALEQDKRRRPSVGGPAQPLVQR